MKSASFARWPFPPATRHAGAIVIAVAWLLVASTSSSERDHLPLTIRYPGDGARIPSVARSFVFGAAPPGAAVSVNGTPAWTAPDGGWIAYLPFAPGRFALHVRVALGAAAVEAVRIVYVDPDTVATFPDAITIVQPGEVLQLVVAAPAGSRVTATGPGFAGIALAPAPNLGPDAYAASARAPSVASGPQPVAYAIAAPSGSTSIVRSHGSLEIARRPVLFVGGVVPYSPDAASGARPYGMLGPTPSAPTEFTAPLGTPFAVTGRQGDQLRVALGSTQSAWIDRREVAADRSLAAPASPTIFGIEKRDTTHLTSFIVRLSARVPIRIREALDPAQLFVTIYGAKSDRTISLRPEQRTLWGYRAAWSGTDLEIAVKKPPRMAAPPQPALTGLLVVVDPGHAPDSGAIGPVGTIERDVNLDIADRLAARLRALGAHVAMTRVSNAPVKLYDRPALAQRLDADVLISVHNNAWPDGVDPSKHHGYSVYYFQPHSLALAQALHAAYGRDTDLPDAGLYKGDLALVRTSELPAVLIESAFISWPEEEMKLRDPAFRLELARTMADGMERWAQAMRRKENGL